MVALQVGRVVGAIVVDDGAEEEAELGSILVIEPAATAVETERGP